MLDAARWCNHISLPTAKPRVAFSDVMIGAHRIACGWADGGLRPGNPPLVVREWLASAPNQPAGREPAVNRNALNQNVFEFVLALRSQANESRARWSVGACQIRGFQIWLSKTLTFQDALGLG